MDDWWVKAMEISIKAMITVLMLTFWIVVAIALSIAIPSAYGAVKWFLFERG